MWTRKEQQLWAEVALHQEELTGLVNACLLRRADFNELHRRAQLAEVHKHVWLLERTLKLLEPTVFSVSTQGQWEKEQREGP